MAKLAFQMRPNSVPIHINSGTPVNTGMIVTYNVHCAVGVSRKYMVHTLLLILFWKTNSVFFAPIAAHCRERGKKDKSSKIK